MYSRFTDVLKNEKSPSTAPKVPKPPKVIAEEGDQVPTLGGLGTLGEGYPHNRNLAPDPDSPFDAIPDMGENDPTIANATNTYNHVDFNDVAETGDAPCMESGVLYYPPPKVAKAPKVDTDDADLAWLGPSAHTAVIAEPDGTAEAYIRQPGGRWSALPVRPPRFVLPVRPDRFLMATCTGWCSGCGTSSTWRADPPQPRTHRVGAASSANARAK
jgi:hypothetical protein